MNSAHAHDNPSLILVSNVLDGTNYIPWSRSMLLAINAKHKTRFIMNIDQPVDLASDEYRKWKETDDLVFSWILNSLSKELGSVFMYATSSKQFWENLKEMYGQSNGPLIFQLRREICSLTQGNSTLADFFNRIKQKWDEYAIIKPISTCTCVDAIRKAQAQIEEEKVMQLLAGLHADYDHIRDQILITDPLPSVSKAYSMLMSVESQRKTGIELSSEFANASMTGGNNRAQSSRGGNQLRTSSGGNNTTRNPTNGGGRGFQAGFQSNNKEDKFCSHCRKSEHDKSGCFKLIGYPEWFGKGKKGNGNGNRYQANMSRDQLMSPIDDNCSDDGDALVGSPQQDSMQSLIQKEVQREMQKLIKGKEQPQDNRSNYDFSAFVGMCSSHKYKGQQEFASWIVDSGASVHMTYRLDCLQNVRKVVGMRKVYLPTGESQAVQSQWDVVLSPELTLYNVLYVPQFKYNLLSMSKMLHDQGITATFLTQHCILQRQEEHKVLAVGVMKEGLYYLTNISFHRDHFADVNEIQSAYVEKMRSLVFAVKDASESEHELWHKRL
ncbi:hypothetical protein M5689_020236 [Euphorbia peplus]|nr:hypothetical protein M5689_020236 [Euphorbia peplus]